MDPRFQIVIKVVKVAKTSKMPRGGMVPLKLFIVSKDSIAVTIGLFSKLLRLKDSSEKKKKKIQATTDSLRKVTSCSMQNFMSRTEGKEKVT